jgi:hypothetical protein
VNPFRDLGIYTDEVLKTYQGKNRLEVTMITLFFAGVPRLFCRNTINQMTEREE